MSVSEAMQISPRGKMLLVLAEPRREATAGGILLPGVETGAEKVTEGTGRVVKIGTHEKFRVLGLEPGQRVLYRGFLKYACWLCTSETWEDGTKKHFFLMDVDDVLSVVPEGVDVGVFSGRPMVPERGAA